MLVCEYFGTEKITLSKLHEIADVKGSSYWASCVEFVSDIWTSNIDGLSKKQNEWLSRILEDCVEYKIEKKNDFRS